MKTALLLVDVQRDFVPGGSLGVPEGDQIIPILDELVKMPFDHIVATKDWHPRNHGSFASVYDRKPGDVVDLDGIEQILWPVHCVQETPGCDFVPGWNTSRIEKVFHKGVNPMVDSYSTFFDNARRQSTGLEDYLKAKGVTRIFLAGLATDYCVKYSAMDAVELGFDTYIIADACRGMELHPGDIEHALHLTKGLGGHVCNSRDVLELLAQKSKTVSG